MGVAGVAGSQYGRNGLGGKEIKPSCQKGIVQIRCCVACLVHDTVRHANRLFGKRFSADGCDVP